MNELINDVVATLTANGGEMSYRDLLDTVPFEKRSLLTRSLKMARQQGILTPVVEWKPEQGGIVHTYKLLGQVEGQGD